MGKEQQRVLERPGLELRDLEGQLERHNVAAAQAGDAELDRRTAEFLASARGIATRLSMDGSGIPREDGPVTDSLPGRRRGAVKCAAKWTRSRKRAASCPRESRLSSPPSRR